jgi:hypothetical protein
MRKFFLSAVAAALSVVVVADTSDACHRRGRRHRESTCCTAPTPAPCCGAGMAPGAVVPGQPLPPGYAPMPGAGQPLPPGYAPIPGAGGAESIPAPKRIDGAAPKKMPEPKKVT